MRATGSDIWRRDGGGEGEAGAVASEAGGSGERRASGCCSHWGPAKAVGDSDLDIGRSTRTPSSISQLLSPSGLATPCAVYSLRLALASIASGQPPHLAPPHDIFVCASPDASMASTDAAGPVQQALKEEHTDANHADLTSPKDSVSSTHGVHEVAKGAGECSGEASPAPSSPTSGLSTTKAGTQTPSVTGQTNPPPLSMPHPKKFSHVNINKKFLEKTSASTPSLTFSASPVTKTASTSRESRGACTNLL